MALKLVDLSPDFRRSPCRRAPEKIVKSRRLPEGPCPAALFKVKLATTEIAGGVAHVYDLQAAAQGHS
jgi:hypothetical protein